MSSDSFFRACQEGDVEKLVEQIESTEGLDISGKDGYGMTALAYAARNGHVEVVRQLLSRGADRTEVLEQGYGKNHPEIAPLLDEGAGPRGNAMEEHKGEETGGIQHGMPFNQMPEGAYMNGAAYPQQGYPMMSGFPPPGQQYYYDGMQQGNGPPQAGSGRRPSHQQHMRKDSSVNLPPPEVARLIPCRFFPNCKYGDKCMFAHPIMAMSGGATQAGGPLSPSMSQPHMQPIFYQQGPSGYPYPGPYGAGPQQPFYAPMGPPNPMQQQQQAHQQPYGIPSHFSPSMIHPHPQQHMHIAPHQQTPPAAEGSFNESEDQSRSGGPTGEQQTAQVDESSPSTSHPRQEVGGQDDKVEIPLPAVDQSGLEQERDAAATPPQQDVAAPLGLQEQVEGKEASAVGEEGEQDTTLDAQGKPVHRRQSFNSFLHHHAIPFQPSVQTGAEMGIMGTMQAYPARMGPKNRRTQGTGGPNGYVGKRSNGERPACTFFANGRCRFGDECRFPHILADGTDARPLQAQQRQMLAAQYGTGNAAAMRNAGSTAANLNNGVPASTPTGPQAEKKAAAEKQQQVQQVQAGPEQSAAPSLPLDGKAASPSASVTASAAGLTGSAPVVRSNPSKTSTQAAAVASRGSQAGSSSASKKQASQPTQRVPTVNDFPALAGFSPNLNGSTASTPLSPTPQSQAAATPTSSSAAEAVAAVAPVAPSTGPATNGPSATAKANFSAILSAPAPVKAKTNAETTSPAKTTAGADDEEGGKEEQTEKASGEERPKGQGRVSTGSKEAKGRGKEAKSGKADSYKSAAAASPAKTTDATATGEGGEDDFQLVNRSRASNKRPSAGNHTNGSSSDGFATQAKAVAA